MKLLLTGASGFLGKIFYDEWKSAHEVIRIGRNAACEIKTDITVQVPLLPAADMVVHTAGLAHVIPKNQQQEQLFYDVNVKGTSNLLAALENNLPKSFVFVSSVAVYGVESGENIDETYPLLATSPYGKSKIEAEKIILDWGKRKNVNVLILRPPLILGPNATGHLGAMVRAIKKGYYFSVGKADAKRSVVIGTDIARLIPTLLNYEGTFNLTDGYNPTVSEIEKMVAKKLNRRIKKIPFVVAKYLALAGDLLPFFPINSGRLNKLSTPLTFSCQLATNLTAWKPTIYNEIGSL